MKSFPRSYRRQEVHLLVCSPGFSRFGSRRREEVDQPLVIYLQ